ncbi:MAG: hypothetical protein FJY75_12295 [Candidatus Eisenbacteria bacterium]|uniref:histidine kinase n=1 Tax=Eiseniibacteriota bacterium TaxID=2212470 RepID=A0A937XCT9_UNCEI|nr:hypothetical protein [Candidatus Eisenbacteria bacterium]
MPAFARVVPPRTLRARLLLGGTASLAALLIALVASGLADPWKAEAGPRRSAALLTLAMTSLWGAGLLTFAARSTGRLSRAAERVAGEASRWGGATGAAAPEGGDEAARLNEAFGEMTRRATDLRAELERANLGLQSQIRQRTAELRQKNLALAFQNEKVTEANRLKSAFFANVSHELRTPLNAILALNEMLRDGIPGPVNDAQRQHLTLAYNSGVKLLQLINEVLDLSRIEAGRMEVVREQVAIVDRLLEAAEGLRALAEEKGLRLVIEAQGTGRSVRTDAAKLQQILVNLLGNAIKFTAQGAVTARIHLLGDESLMSVEVEDTGPGIPAEEQPRIFLEFHRVEGALTEAAPGTGLGLTISKRLVHLLGGDIWVDSVVGRGSRFAFVVPLGAEAARGTGAGEQEGGEAEEREEGRARVLLVADDLVEAGVLGRYFRQRGVEVERARNEFEMQRIVQAGGLGLALVVADPRSPARSAVLVEEIARAAEAPPVILYADREPDPEALARIQGCADALFVKGARGLGELVDLGLAMMRRGGSERPAGGESAAVEPRAA